MDKKKTLSTSQENTENTIFRRVKGFLLQEELDAQQSLENRVNMLTVSVQELARMNNELRHPEEMRKVLEPHFRAHLSYVKEHFPDLFQPMVQASVQSHLKESQKEVIDALHPIMGRLIKKYIISELEKLSQQIDRQLDRALSWENMWLRIKMFFGGVKPGEYVIHKEISATLEEIFVIQQETGLLLGHYSVEDRLNSDMVAGMLTGIKEFIEHAFQVGEQNLETLQYENYYIIVQNFHTFYFACLVEGKVDGLFKQKLEKTIFSFYEKYPIRISNNLTKEFTDQISADLISHFNGFNKVDK